MRRFVPVLLAGAVVLALVAGVAVLAAGDGPYAFRVGGHTVSQRSIDEELQALAGNSVLEAGAAQLVAQNPQAEPLTRSEGSITVGYGTGWVSLTVAQEIVRQRVEREGLEPTRADRVEARALARQAVGGAEAFAELPRWFRERIAARWTPVAILDRRLIASPTPALLEAAAAECPSGRYVAHILVATELEAEAIKTQLDGGADFPTLAQANSTDTGSAESGGYYGCLDALRGAVEPFLDAATNQPIGEVSDPVQTEFGYHLVLVTDAPSSAELSSLAVSSVLETATRGTNVSVDPRYGTWDRANGQVLPPGATSAAG